MMRGKLCLSLSALWIVAAGAAERERLFDFSVTEPGRLPPGFVSLVSGEGKPGTWEIALDDAPSAFPSITGRAPQTSKRRVLAQTARDRTDEHFPLLVFGEEVYDDFTFTAKVKLVEGAIEQMAGLAFRIQDEKNYYVARISGLGNNFRFYKFVEGARSTPIGPELEIARGQWHEITVECRGNRIRCLLNGREAMPPLNDTSFSKGKVAFWTKSDAVSYFTDARVSFRPRESLAQALVREALQTYPRLAGLQVYAIRPGAPEVQVIASAKPDEVGQSGGPTERAVIEQGSVFYGRLDKLALVTVPLRDRNGETVAAVRVILNSFPGQTEANAVGRATPVVKLMQQRTPSLKELLE